MFVVRNLFYSAENAGIVIAREDEKTHLFPCRHASQRMGLLRSKLTPESDDWLLGLPVNGTEARPLIRRGRRPAQDHQENIEHKQRNGQVVEQGRPAEIRPELV